MAGRRSWLLARLRRQIWFRAAVIGAFSVLVAATAGVLARRIPYTFTGDVGQDAVGTLLGIMASSMLAVTTFSLTAMVGAYGSATQLATPRATQLLIGDTRAQNALSTFLGAFIFSMVGIVGLQTHVYGGQGRVVLLIATVLVIAVVVVTLLRWIAHLAAFGRMADVIDRVEDAASAAMVAFVRAPCLGGVAAVPVPAGATPIHPPVAGYVTHVDVDALADVAQTRGLVIHVASVARTLVHAARPLMHVEGVVDTHDRARLVRAFTVERHRTFDHDPRLGVIALAEIASRALAPATNDPGTAIEVLNALLRTLSHLSGEPPPSIAGRVGVHVPRPTIDDLLDDAFLPFVRDAVGEAEVAMRTFRIMAALGATVPDADAPLRRLAAHLHRRIGTRQDDPIAVDRLDAVYRADWS